MHSAIKKINFITSTKNKPMETEFKIARTSRKIFANLLDTYTPEQLNTIPEGWNNNLIWHIGHIIVSQQLLVYAGSGLAPMISKDMIALYVRGTKPERNATQEEIDEMKSSSLLFKKQKKITEMVFLQHILPVKAKWVLNFHLQKMALPLTTSMKVCI